jgi:molybdopterin biosynthesis enzyme
VEATLVEGFTRSVLREGYLPAWTEWSREGFFTRRLPWMDSSDLGALPAANSLLVSPVGEEELREGRRVEVLLLPEFLMK